MEMISSKSKYNNRNNKINNKQLVSIKRLIIMGMIFRTIMINNNSKYSKFNNRARRIRNKLKKM